jgi:hypothetical protein
MCCAVLCLARCNTKPRWRRLGKTVEVLGLVLSRPAPAHVIAGARDPESGKIISRGTLVVCAVSLVGQVLAGGRGAARGVVC